jgi:ABC-type transport system involved in cytochrome bd biosynthesis fused ATPase/permease subunit
MLTLLIISSVAGLAVSGLTGIGFLGLAAGVFFFVCGLPGALLVSFVRGEVSYAQDRADYREAVSGTVAEEMFAEHEYAEDERIDRLVEAVKRKRDSVTYNDNRQVRVYGIRL